MRPRGGPPPPPAAPRRAVASSVTEDRCFPSSVTEDRCFPLPPDPGLEGALGEVVVRQSHVVLEIADLEERPMGGLDVLDLRFLPRPHLVGMLPLDRLGLEQLALAVVVVDLHRRE